MSTSVDIDEVITNLKATITSNKGGVFLHNLEHDYNCILGEHLPYQQLGYNSLIEFIYSTEAFKVEKQRDNIIIYVKSDEKTQHLEQMIQKQKPAKKRPTFKRFPNGYNNNNTTTTTHSANTVNTRWPKHNNNTIKKLEVVNDQIYNNIHFNRKKTWKSVPDDFSKNARSVGSEPLKNSPVKSLPLKSSLVKSPEMEVQNSEVQSVDSEPVKSPSVMSLPVMSPPSVKRPPMNIKPVKTKVYAQDRLQKYVKKTVEQMENKTFLNAFANLKYHLKISECENLDFNQIYRVLNETIVRKEFEDLTSILCSNIKISDRIKVFHDFISKVSNNASTEQSMEPSTELFTESSVKTFTESSTHFPEECDYNIQQLKIENKCKKTVTVTAINSPLNIWVVMDDTEKNITFKKMQKGLNKMTSGNNFVKRPIIGCNYALFHQQMWHRIVIETVDVSNLFKCLLIDNGKRLLVHRSHIYPLEPKYFSVCGQAINIALNKFKFLNDFPFVNDVLNEVLLYKKFVLIPNNIFTSPITVNFYDLETMINVNEIMLNFFFEKATPTFCLENVHAVFEATVLSTDENGYWYLQKDTSVIEPLENLFKMEDLFSAPRLKNARDIDYKNVYLAPYDGIIKGRVKVLHFVDTFELKVFFIDYGVCRIIEITELIDLNKIDKRLANIPCQAVKVVLHMFPPQHVTPEIVETFFELMGDNDNRVIVINVKDLSKNIPCVQLLSVSHPTTCLNMIVYKRFKKLIQP